MQKITTLLISTLAVGLLAGCNTHKKQNSSSTSSKTKVATTKLELLGNMKSNSKGIYNLRGKTNPKAKVHYRYKVGTETSVNSFKADKAGNFKIRVINDSPTQKNTTVKVTVKTQNRKSNFDLALIENMSSNYASRASQRAASVSLKDAAKDSSRAAKSSKEASEDASISRLVESESKENDSKRSTKPSYGSRYKSVSLDDFIADPDKYSSKDIKTSGTVSYIQRNPDDKTMDYVVLNNSDNSVATVAEIEVEDMHSKGISEGDSITVKGGGLTQTVKLNGKTLESDIIVDYVSVN